MNYYLIVCKPIDHPIIKSKIYWNWELEIRSDDTCSNGTAYCSRVHSESQTVFSVCKYLMLSRSCSAHFCCKCCWQNLCRCGGSDVYETRERFPPLKGWPELPFLGLLRFRVDRWPEQTKEDKGMARFCSRTHWYLIDSVLFEGLTEHRKEDKLWRCWLVRMVQSNEWWTRLELRP